MDSRLQKQLFVKPTLLSFYIGKVLGQAPSGVVQIVTKDGRVFTQFVPLEDRQ